MKIDILRIFDKIFPYPEYSVGQSKTSIPIHSKALKRDGEYCMILNLKELNEYVVSHHFQMVLVSLFKKLFHKTVIWQK